MRLHKLLSCAIHRYSFLQHGMNDDAECSHLHQIWPEEDSSVEWFQRSVIRLLFVTNVEVSTIDGVN